MWDAVNVTFAPTSKETPANLRAELFEIHSATSSSLTDSDSIKNRWSIIFDWSVGQQSIFFSIMEFRSSIFDHSILEWSNDPFFSDFFFICFTN